MTHCSFLFFFAQLESVEIPLFMLAVYHNTSDNNATFGIPQIQIGFVIIFFLIFILCCCGWLVG